MSNSTNGLNRKQSLFGMFRRQNDIADKRDDQSDLQRRNSKLGLALERVGSRFFGKSRDDNNEHSNFKENAPVNEADLGEKVEIATHEQPVETQPRELRKTKSILHFFRKNEASSSGSGAGVNALPRAKSMFFGQKSHREETVLVPRIVNDASVSQNLSTSSTQGKSHVEFSDFLDDPHSRY
jgi:hypothetical protein